MKRGKFHFGNVRFGRLVFTVVAASLCIMALAPVAKALPINLGDAGDYAILGIGGTVSVKSNFEVYQSATVVNGNVGVGPYSNFAHGIDATINGRLDYDTTDTLPSITGTITDGTHKQDMSGIVAAAIAAEGLSAALTPTQSYSTLSSGQTITGNGGLNVIRVTGPVEISGGSTTLKLVGTASDQFVFQLTGVATPDHTILTLSGVDMILSDGVTADDILWDLHGTGGGIKISSGASVYGTFLAPYRDILSDNGTIEGRLIGGGPGGTKDGLSVHSGSKINSPSPVPEPATILLLGTGLLGLCGLCGARRKFNK